MSEVLRQVMTLIPKLSSAEVVEVRKALSALDSLGGGHNGSGAGVVFANDVTWVLTIILECFPEVDMPVAVLRRSRQFKSFNDKLPGVLRWLRNASDRRIQQQALLRAGVGLLKLDISRSANITVTPGVVMSQIHTLPETFNRHFPGYIEAGLLALVLRPEVSHDL